MLRYLKTRKQISPLAASYSIENEKELASYVRIIWFRMFICTHFLFFVNPKNVQPLLFLSRLEKQSVKSIFIVDTLLIQLYSLHFH